LYYDLWCCNFWHSFTIIYSFTHMTQIFHQSLHSIWKLNLYIFSFLLWYGFEIYHRIRRYCLHVNIDSCFHPTCKLLNFLFSEK
jgi:hypothetical protein